MSGQATGWVLRNGPQNRAQRAVLIAIADAANADGEHAHPGQDGIMRASLYSRGHVRRILSELREEGWIEVTENEDGGRGLATEFCLPGMKETRAPCAPLDDKRAHFESETRASPQSAPITTTLKNNIPEPKPPVTEEVLDLCDHLADRVGLYRGGLDQKPKSTHPAWTNPMRLLCERGPANRAKPQAISANVVKRAIDFVFDELATPYGPGSFCWASVIQSPSSLREKWDKICDEKRKRGGAVIHDASSKTLSDEEKLHAQVYWDWHTTNTWKLDGETYEEHPRVYGITPVERDGWLVTPDLLRYRMRHNGGMEMDHTQQP